MKAIDRTSENYKFNNNSYRKIFVFWKKTHTLLDIKNREI
jgi:hypothetical protein